MSETAIKPADGPPDALLLADSESLAYVAWCKEQIAEGCYVVQLPPKPWAGRDDIVNKCSRTFKTDILVASNAVDQAVLGMWNPPTEDPGNFLKQAMRLRLQGIRQLILKAMTDGRQEQTFKYEPHKDDSMKLVESKVKEKRYKGIDMAAIDKLLAVERVLADLEGLWGDSQKQGVNIVDSFFAGLDKLQDKNREAEDAEAKSIASRALRAKSRNMSGPLNEAQHRLLASIVQPTEPGETKEVKATVVTKPRGKVIEAAGISVIAEDDEDSEEDDE